MPTLLIQLMVAFREGPSPGYSQCCFCRTCNFLIISVELVPDSFFQYLAISLKYWVGDGIVPAVSKRVNYYFKYLFSIFLFNNIQVLSNFVLFCKFIRLAVSICTIPMHASILSKQRFWSSLTYKLK